MSESDEFERVRSEPDPIRRGRRATELLTMYQQRATELARLRRSAIEQAHDEQGMNYTEIAAALGITKGRVTQIRSTAPTPERSLFGVGPIAIGVPYRYRTTDRERPLIAAEDAQAADGIELVLESLGFVVTRFQIEPDQTDLPETDAVVFCGPKSAPLGAKLLDRDPMLGMAERDGLWCIVGRDEEPRQSPSDLPNATPADLAYIGKHKIDGRSILHIAGLHAIGSLGAVHYLTAHLADLYRGVRDEPFSVAIRASYDNLVITDSEVETGPFAW